MTLLINVIPILGPILIEPLNGKPVFLVLLTAEFLFVHNIYCMSGSDGLVHFVKFFLLHYFLACKLVVLSIDFEVNIDVDIAGGVLPPALFLIHLSIQMIQIGN